MQTRRESQSVFATIRKIGYRSVETFSGQYAHSSAKELRTLITDGLNPNQGTWYNFRKLALSL